VVQRNRERPPARRPAFKSPKPRMLIVTEGAVTEKKYLEGMIAWLKNSRVDFKVIGGVGVPATIVQFALDLKRSAEEKSRLQRDDNLRYEEIWCAFDVDQHPKLPEVCKLAQQHGIELAISNPCFELWIWLHFDDSPGVQSPQSLQCMLRRYLPDYRKHVRFSDVSQGYHDAVRRAEQLDHQAQAVGRPGRNPTTGIWRLTENIRRIS
jgi:hypothetical protein